MSLATLILIIAFLVMLVAIFRRAHAAFPMIDLKALGLALFLLWFLVRLF